MTDIVGAVGQVFPAFVHLVIVDDLRFSVRENNALIGDTQVSEFGHGQDLIAAVVQQE